MKPHAPVDPHRLAPQTSRRDVVIAVAIGVAVLIIVLVGLWSLSGRPRQPSTNQLTGTILAKHATGEREQEITFGRKGLKQRETDSGYSFEIRVEPEGRTYTVPVTKELYESKKVGEKQSFIRPRGEQR